MDRRVGDVFTAQPDVTSRRWVEARNRVEGTGLAGSIGADERRDLPGGRSQGHVTQRMDAAET